nr:Dihydrofolate reductase [uncultured bacterium]
MNKPKISIFAALSENHVIGVKGGLPWHIPDDFKRMKEVTMGHTIVMGRKTYESIGRVLPKRTNIIISRDPDYKVDGGIVRLSLDEALTEAKKHETDEIFIFGGGQIFEQAMPITDKLYLTIVHKNIEGDTYFPDYSMFIKKVFEQKGTSNGFDYTFLELKK